MYDEMTINDAINVANVLSDVLASDANDDVQELAIAARRLARQIGEQSRELERERARSKTGQTVAAGAIFWRAGRCTPDRHSTS